MNVNKSMNNFVEMAHFEKFPPFREWRYVQGTQHITVTSHTSGGLRGGKGGANAPPFGG